MFCLSKGLCAPVGSMLAGTRKFIEKARKGRKLMGGGMRQTGILAAAGLVALEKMRPRLAEDHENAVILGRELEKIPGIDVQTEDIHINMVYFNIGKTGCNSSALIDGLLRKGIKANPPEDGVMRLVTNYWVSLEDVYYTVQCFKELIKYRF
jgi:threonine aldolase